MQIGDPGCVCPRPQYAGQCTFWEEGMSARGLVALPPLDTPRMQQSAVHLLQEQNTNLLTSTLSTNQEGTLNFALERGDKAQRAVAMGLARAHRSCLEHTWETPPLPQSSSWFPVYGFGGQWTTNLQLLMGSSPGAAAPVSWTSPSAAPACLCRHPLSVWEPEPSLGTSSAGAGHWCLVQSFRFVVTSAQGHIHNVVKIPQYPHSLPGAPNPHPPGHQVLPRNSKEISRPVFLGKLLQHNSIFSWSLAWLH